MTDQERRASSWPAQQGEMAERIRNYDWAAAPLGQVETWPQSLRVAVRLILGSRQPMFIWWGAECTRLYNDACIAILGPERHPHVLGASARREPSALWTVIGPQIEHIMAGGEATWQEDATVPVFRHGDWQDARWDYSLSPLDDPSTPSGVGGVLAICKEVTREHTQREELRASEARLQAAIHLVGLCPYSVDLATNTREWDDRLRAIWGLPSGAHVDAEVFLSGIHPDDRARVEAAIAIGADPAGSGIYHLEYRVIGIEDSVERWVSVHGRTVFKNGQPARFEGAALEITDRKRAEERLLASEQRLHLLVAELQHRTRNLLAVVNSMADQTLAKSASLVDFSSRFQPRLKALARVNSLLSSLQGDERITFDALIRMELAGVGAVDGNGNGPQVRLDGPTGVRLRPSAVQTLALGLHELAINALKYGALAQPQGQLQVGWDLLKVGASSQQLRITWAESGVLVLIGPGAPPLRRGYGRVLIEQALPYQLGAKTTYDLHSDGLHCTITLPLPPEQRPSQ